MPGHVTAQATTDSGPAPDGVPARCRVRLDIAYDGTDFSGWAVQPDRRTVAGELTRALERLFGGFDTAAGRSSRKAHGATPGAEGATTGADATGWGNAAAGQVPGVFTGLTVAGRTDAGVHATGQVAHVDLPEPRWEELRRSVVRRLAGLLPGDVRVLAARRVPAEFDARFSALWRRYEYRVTDAEFGVEPLRRRDTLAWPRPLDLTTMDAAAAGLCGEHDFVAFCRRKEHATTVRRITRLSWRRDTDGILVATVQADAFCQQMVRSLVGAMLAVGDGRRSPQWPAQLLRRTERASEVVVAPPHGLTLVEVGYPGEAGYAARAEATRRLRERLPQ